MPNCKDFVLESEASYFLPSDSVRPNEKDGRKSAIEYFANLIPVKTLSFSSLYSSAFSSPKLTASLGVFK